MALVSQWAGIESGASTAPLRRRGVGRLARSAQPARPAEPRLRRSDHLVLGSIDAAAHVLQRRARVVLVGSAVFMVPMLALNLLLSVLAFDDFDGVRQPVRRPRLRRCGDRLGVSGRPGGAVVHRPPRRRLRRHRCSSPIRWAARPGSASVGAGGACVGCRCCCSPGCSPTGGPSLLALLVVSEPCAGRRIWPSSAAVHRAVHARACC